MCVAVERSWSREDTSEVPSSLMLFFCLSQDIHVIYGERVLIQAAGSQLRKVASACSSYSADRSDRSRDCRGCSSTQTWISFLLLRLGRCCVDANHVEDIAH